MLSLDAKDERTEVPKSPVVEWFWRGRLRGKNRKSTHSTYVSEEINRASFCLSSRATHSWSANLLREQFRNRAFRESCCHHFIEYVLKFSIAGLFLLFLSLSSLSLSLFARVLFSWLFLKNSLFPLLKNELEDIARQIARVVEYTHAEEKDSFFVCDAKSKRAAQQKQKRTSSGVQKATHIQKKRREKRILFKKHLSFFWTHWAKDEGKKRGMSGGGWPPAAENPPVMVNTLYRHLSLARRAHSLFWFIFEKRKRAPWFIYWRKRKSSVNDTHLLSLFSLHSSSINNNNNNKTFNTINTDKWVQVITCLRISTGEITAWEKIHSSQPVQTLSPEPA